MELMFMRHGRTKGNEERRYVGRTDEGILPEETDVLAIIRERLNAGEDAFLPELLFVSPMLRTRQTAQIVFPEMEQILVEDLREADFGSFEYKTYEDIKDDPAYQAYIDSGGRTPFPGAEDGDAFRRRCCDAFSSCLRNAKEQDAQRIAFVIHGGTVMAVLERFAKEGGYYEWHMENGEAYLAEYEEDTGRIRVRKKVFR